MNKTFEAFVTVLTAVSVVVILIDYAYNLTEEQKLIIYIFDSAVVVILGLDFYKRMRSSDDVTKIGVILIYNKPGAGFYNGRVLPSFATCHAKSL
jgi:hypothetical protein